MIEVITNPEGQRNDPLVFAVAKKIKSASVVEPHQMRGASCMLLSCRTVRKRILRIERVVPFKNGQGIEAFRKMTCKARATNQKAASIHDGKLSKDRLRNLNMRKKTIS